MQRLNSFPKSHNFAIKSLFSFFSSLSEAPNTNTFLLNYLIENLKIPKSRALVISNKLSPIKSLERPRTVRQFFHNAGFSDTHIQLIVSAKPEILFSHVDRTLKPKIEYFQHMGLVGSDLGKFISKNPLLLFVSLEKRLIPCVEILKKMLVDDTNNEDFVRVVSRNIRILTGGPEKSGLLRNIEYLKSCGIVGSQLSKLLVRNPRLFCCEGFKLRELVSRALDIGFSTYSRMFVYGLHSLSCLSEETFDRKLEFFRSCGFSKEEFLAMIRSAPGLLHLSEERLKSGFDFFMKKLQFEKAVLVRTPVYLTYSIENRVTPRYRVFQIVTSRRLLKKECSFPPILLRSEKDFLKKFVLRFGDYAEELLQAYKNQSSCSSERNLDVQVGISSDSLM